MSEPGDVLPPAEVKPPLFVTDKLAKALANPLRVKILDELNRRPMSVTQFVRAFPEYTHSQVSGHFSKLLEYECIEEIAYKTGGKRRGGKERFYRPTVRSLFDQTAWVSIPEPLRNKITDGVASAFVARIAEAVAKGTIDSRDDRHISWFGPDFDQQAWDETIAELRGIFERIPIREAEAADRLSKTDDEPISVTIALACFESPPPGRARDA